ncbi:MAG: hypothetical protein NT031_09160 [Planctomycetota bacterium]|nr:hypothetical protein [Planctomycetota bacterium]
MVTMVTTPATNRARPRRDGRAAGGVIAAALLAVIAVAVVAGIHEAWNAGDSPARRERAERPMHFCCERCGHEFGLIPAEFHKQWLDVDPSALAPEARHKAHCPQCGNRYCARLLDGRPQTKP